MTRFKRYCIFTENYNGLLANFSEKAAGEEIIYIKNQHNNGMEVSIVRRERFCAALLELLADIAQAENPVYKYSARLREMAQELRQTPLYAEELQRLKKFVSQSRELNLEGYVLFRMDEFRERLDLLIYSLAKKLKFGNLD